MGVKLERGGLVPGGEETSHDNGGVGYQLEDTKTHIEEEGLEVNIPIEILDLPGDDYEFTGSNFAVLNDILKLGKHTSVGELSLASEVTTVRGGDNVICKRSVWDKTIRTYKGSIRQIVSAINESGACNPIEPGATVIDHNTDELKSKGGVIGEENNIHFEYSLYQLHPKIFLLEVDDAHHLAMLFLRVAEFYEHRIFGGNEFTIDEFSKWYCENFSDKKSFTYPEDWYGFNVPSKSIYKCYEVNTERTAYDKILLEIVKIINNYNKDFYLIGVKKGDSDTLDHEIAHALFYINKKYKKEMTELVDSLPFKDDLLQILNEKRGYGKNVLIDEAQAFMATGLITEIEMYEKFREPFVKIFEKYKGNLEKQKPLITKKLKQGGEIEEIVITDELTLNDKGGYDYTGEAKKIAKTCGLVTLPKSIEGTNCGNCIFQKDGFCDHYKILLPVTSRMCCSLWDDKSIRSIISNFFDAYLFPPKPENTFQLNDRGGYIYTGKALERARAVDLITLPEDIKGTTCAEKNCMYGKKVVVDGLEVLLFCNHPKINLPVTDRMSCAWYDNENIIREWGKPVELTFAGGGKIPSKQRLKDWQAENPNSPRWKKKKEGLEQLSNEIQRLRLNVTKGLKSEDEKEFLTALVVAIILNTGERIGNNDSADNGHFGVTGFTRDHITVTGNKIHLDYVGKRGVAHKSSFSDKRIAEALKKAIKTSPKQIDGEENKFIFVTSDGFRIKDDKVNRYLEDFGITSKVMRGYFSNHFIIKKLSELPIPETEKQRKKLFNKIAKEAAFKVGHEVSTMKKHYMIPELPIWYIQKGKIVNIKKLGYYNDGGNIGDIAIEKHYMQANNVPEVVLETKKDLYKQAEGKDNGIDDVFQQYPVEEVVFESLIPTQDFLNSDKFKKLNLLGENVDKTTPSYIIRNEGKEYVIDGHHRCVKRNIYGKPVLGHIYDIQQMKKAGEVKSLDKTKIINKRGTMKTESTKRIENISLDKTKEVYDYLNSDWQGFHHGGLDKIKKAINKFDVNKKYVTVIALGVDEEESLKDIHKRVNKIKDVSESDINKAISKNSSIDAFVFIIDKNLDYSAHDFASIYFSDWDRHEKFPHELIAWDKKSNRKKIIKDFLKAEEMDDARLGNKNKMEKGGGAMANGGVIGDKRAKEIITYLLAQAKEKGISLPKLQMFVDEGPKPGTLLEAYQEFEEWTNNGKNPKSLRFPYEDSNRFRDYVMQYFPNSAQREMYKHYGEGKIKNEFPDYARGGKITDKEIDTHSYGFGDEQIASIKKILPAVKESLSGKITSWGSGGNFFHLSVQLKDNRWLTFNSGTGDITVSSKPIKTAKQAYDASWDDDTMFFELYIPTGDTENFEQTDKIVKAITESKFLDSGTGKKMAGGGMIFVYNEKDYTPQQLMELAGTSSTREAISKLGTEKVGIKGLGKIPVYQVGAFNKGGGVGNELSNVFYIVVDKDERGEYEATVYNTQDKQVWDINTEELVELQQDGFLKYKPHEDLSGLTKYLISVGFPSNIKILTEGDYNKGNKRSSMATGGEVKIGEFTYILSDEEVKEGDYDYSINYKTITKVDKQREEYLKFPTVKPLYKKVVATDDPKLLKEGISKISSNGSMATGGGLEKFKTGFIQGDVITENQRNPDRYVEVTNKGKTFIVSDIGDRRQVIYSKGNMKFFPPIHQPALEGNLSISDIKKSSSGSMATGGSDNEIIYLKNLIDSAEHHLELAKKQNQPYRVSAIEQELKRLNNRLTNATLPKEGGSMAKGGQQPEVFSPGSVEYKTIDIRSEKGIKEAEALQRQGWIMGSSGADSIQFYRQKRSPLSTGKRMDKGGDFNKGDYITYPRGILGKAIDRVTDECTLDGNKVIHTKDDEYFIEGKDLDVVKKYNPMAKGGVTIGDLNSFIAEINEAGGGEWSLGGAYGFYELWAKDKDGGSHRVEVGSRKDIYQALIKYRYNKKYNPKYAEGIKAKGGSTSDNNEFALGGKIVEEFAKTNNYTIVPINYRGHGQKLQGFDIIDSENRIHYSFEPVHYSNGDRWKITGKTRGVQYVKRLNDDKLTSIFQEGQKNTDRNLNILTMDKGGEATRELKTTFYTLPKATPVHAEGTKIIIERDENSVRYVKDKNYLYKVYLETSNGEKYWKQGNHTWEMANKRAQDLKDTIEAGYEISERKKSKGGYN